MGPTRKGNLIHLKIP